MIRSIRSTAGRPLFLASVKSADEAGLAAACGVDVIDAKNPATGALGALPGHIIGAIRSAVPAGIPVSATTGDLPLDAVDRIVEAAGLADAAGADLIKIGFFPGQSPMPLLARLADEPRGAGRRIAVLVADGGPDLSIVARLPASGFTGVMLDTADKLSGSLTDILEDAFIERFVGAARAAGLTAGLAGALRLRHIPQLTALQPDVLGFRGALCGSGRRDGMLEREKVLAVRHALEAGGTQLNDNGETAFNP